MLKHVIAEQIHPVQGRREKLNDKGLRELLRVWLGISVSTPTNLFEAARWDWIRSAIRPPAMDLEGPWRPHEQA